MKKYLAMLVAGLLCACCLGLAACGGSSSSSAASGSASTSASAASASTSAASASTSAASTSASASSAAASTASASASAASSAAADEVNPELKAAAEALVAVADEEAAFAKKAKEAGDFNAVKAEWDELSKRVNAATSALAPWAQKYANGELSDAEKAYYMKVVVPAASKSASAGLEVLDLIQK